MTRRTIGGPLDMSALAMLHRPKDNGALAREARRLAADGLTYRDIAAAMRLAPAAVGELLASDDLRPLSGGVK